MYLLHDTDAPLLNKILDSGGLLSNYITGEINFGDGIYKKKNKNIFFHLIKSEKEITPYFDAVFMLFSPKMLSQYDFYLSTFQTPTPAGHPHTTKILKGHTLQFINKKLQQLYKDAFYSTNDLNYLHNQIAFVGFGDLKYLEKIVVSSKFPKNILDKLKANYPSVEIICKK
jgi:hypothetical protein